MANYNWQRHRNSRARRSARLRGVHADSIIINDAASISSSNLSINNLAEGMDVVSLNAGPVSLKLNSYENSEVELENCYIKAENIKFDFIGLNSLSSLASDSVQDALEELDRENRDLKQRLSDVEIQVAQAQSEIITLQ